MGLSESSLQVATVASAVLWPLLAGVGVVAWSRARAAAYARRVSVMERGLTGMYRTLEARPIPTRLTMVLDALQEGEELAPAARARSLTLAAR